jgi:hypothetical protein
MRSCEAVFVLGPLVRGSGRAAVGSCATSQRHKRPQSRHVIAPPLVEGCGHNDCTATYMNRRAGAWQTWPSHMKTENGQHEAHKSERGKLFPLSSSPSSSSPSHYLPILNWHGHYEMAYAAYNVVEFPYININKLLVLFKIRVREQFFYEWKLSLLRFMVQVVTTSAMMSSWNMGCI